MSYVAEYGAMVIVAPEGMLDRDIEISPSGSDADRTAGAVHRRVKRNSPPRYTAEFASLAPGDYTIWQERGGRLPLATVAVVAGKVTEVSLPAELKELSPGM